MTLLLARLFHRKSYNINAIKQDRKCPLCQNSLKKGERVFTEAFPGKDNEKIVHLHGCPFCRKPKKKQKRKCPVCKRTLGYNDYLIGKMWGQEKKIRVHILCCSICGRKGMK